MTIAAFTRTVRLPNEVFENHGPYLLAIVRLFQPRLAVVA
jgi:uncharacterized OB-fold protein